MRRIRVLLAIAGACASATAPLAAQTRPAAPVPAAQIGSGCNGGGPGIIAGRSPGFVPGAVGSIRVVPGDADGEAFMTVSRELDNTYQGVAKLKSDPKALAEFEKNPQSSPFIPHYTGNPNDGDAILAWLKARTATFARANAATSEIATAVLGKDGSFSCRGLRSGHYHVVITYFVVPPADALSMRPAAHGQTNSYEGSADIPRAEPGQHVLVEVSQYRELMALKH